MSERISDTNNGTANSEARTPRFNRSKTVQVIISILVALALWVYVDVEKAPERTKTIRDVPVEFSGENTTLADKNLMLLSGYDTTIDLTIRGPKRELVKMSRDNVRVIASTSSIDSVGVHQLDWTVSFPDGVVRTNVSVEKASQSQITVTVGELYTKEVPGTRSVVQTVDVQLYDYDGNLVENSNIRTSASLIQAKVPVLTTKEVALAIEFEGVPGAAADSIVCDIAPKTVRLNGEADVLASIDKLVLATLHVDDLGLHQQNSYVVTPPDGTWLVNGNEVATADITLDGISETTLTVTDLSFTNLPAGLYAVVPEGGLTVRLWGLSEEIEAITAENLRATADMSTVTGQGSFTVPATVTVSGFSDVTVRGTYELTLTITDTPPQTEPAVPAGGEDQTVPEVPET